MRSVNIFGLQLDVPESVNDVATLAQRAPSNMNFNAPSAIIQTLGANKNLQTANAVARMQPAVAPFVPTLSNGQPMNVPVNTTSTTNTTYNTPGTITSGGATTLSQEIPNVKPFSYDWTGEENKAYTSLEAFYNKLLDFSGGKLDLAKRILEYTYQQGLRETKDTYDSQKGEYERLFPQENAQLSTNLNKRGVLDSGFGKSDVGVLKAGQDARMLAVENAKANKESRLSAQRGFDLETNAKTSEEEKFNLERQRRQEAQQMASRTYGIKGDQYNSQLQVAQQAEARRVQGLTNNATQGIIGGATTGASATSSGSRPSGYGVGDDEFKRFMQSTGKQAELDKATSGSTQQGAQYYAMKRSYGF
jgi:hypothetical protein